MSALEAQAEGAPAQHQTRAVPSQEGITGVLRACEEQTSMFNWAGLIEAVASQLDIEDGDASSPIVPAIFRGATTMFPMVQTLPQDREVVIETDSGLCVLVVWAHHILGLSVLVRHNTDLVYAPGTYCETTFGKNKPNVTIEYNLSFEGGSSITLLEASTKESLFTIRPHSDEDETIDPVVKRPVKGYGRRVLESTWTSFAGAFNATDGREATIRDTIHITGSFALIIGRELCKHSSMSPEASFLKQGPKEKHEPAEANDFEKDDIESAKEPRDDTLMCSIPEQKILEVTQLLFDGQNIKPKTIEEYVAMYSGSALHAVQPPKSICAASELAGYDLALWKETFLTAARDLCILILALAHAIDLDAIGALLLNCELPFIHRHGLIQRVWNWNGQDTLYVGDGTWFEIVSLLMVGHRDTMDLTFIRSASLISESGWTVYMNSHGNLDPSYLEPGQIVIRQGVPCRNGVRKHAIIDLNIASVPRIIERMHIHHPGEKVSLYSGIVTKWGHPFVGERGDNFVVSIRIFQEQMKHSTTRRSGYRELSRALWLVHKTTNCKHDALQLPQLERRGESFLLPPDCAAIAVQGDTDMISCTEKLVICLSTENAAARWRSLISLDFIRNENLADGPVSVLLRGEGCCIQCAINQGSISPGKCYVVL